MRLARCATVFIIAGAMVLGAGGVLAGFNPLGGLIAFDEFHQGRGEAHNQIATYFAGTPVLAMCGQLILIAIVAVWSLKFPPPSLRMNCTGRRVSVTGIDLVRVAGGRIVEHRGLTDTVGLLRQLGGG